ncbi:MAG: TIGR04283 family arsenosugar biosynthesis glycosyltransferase [Desulfobulbaceae bacterium]|nr:TIGR04283 family arsenosugar biosynthesis glycosyltransferase [Desulfobulbaceae bacterium]HIJ78368.1 glycosyltransferase family 2 protein [Deltaproteobacteria bacterium]
MSIDPKTCDISVIIPTLNEEGVIGAVMAALAGESGVEVIVADGGSTDETVRVAAALGARIVMAPAGRGGQLNRGAAIARGRILLFLHADTRLPKNFAAAIIGILARPGVVGGAFSFGVDGGQVGFRLLEFFVNLRSRFLRLPYGDQALFLDAAMFDRIGGYSEIPLFEDVDLVRRLGRKGRLVTAAAKVVTSARRWRHLGLLKTTLVNQVLLLGYFLGVSPFRLAVWYEKEKIRQ